MLKRTDEERAQSAMYALIRSALRRVWLRYPERSKCLLGARRAYKGVNKRQLWEFNCAECGKWCKATDVCVDHIVPCGTFLKEEHWATFGPNLFCNASKLQVLCKEPCHKEKTAEERRKK